MVSRLILQVRTRRQHSCPNFKRYYSIMDRKEELAKQLSRRLSKESLKHWVQILQILAEYGACTANEIYGLSFGTLTKSQVSRALEAMTDSWWPWPFNSEGHGALVNPRPYFTEKPARQKWSLTRQGQDARKAFCSECYTRLPNHLPGCSKPPAICRVRKPNPTEPSVLASLLEK